MGLSDGETTQIPCLQFRRPAAENHLKITTSRLCPFVWRIPGSVSPSY